MSKKQHEKQLERARTKRKASKYDRRAARNKIVIIVMAGLMVLSLVAGSLALLFTGNDTPAVPEPGEEEAAEGPCPTATDQDVPVPTGVQYDAPPSFPMEGDATYVAILHTTCGDIEVELDAEGTPRTAENFLALAEDGFYAGVPFHRTIQGFMIQGGDPTGTGTGGPGYTFEGETETAEAFEPYTPEDMPGLEEGEAAPDFGDSVAYPRGTIAMANTGDPDTQSSQFFIVQGDPAPLPPLYTAFGEVVAGMDVVDDIAAGPVGGQQRDQALDPVFITDVTIDER